jgi:hypothetical protein
MRSRLSNGVNGQESMMKILIIVSIMVSILTLPVTAVFAGGSDSAGIPFSIRIDLFLTAILRVR